MPILQTTTLTLRPCQPADCADVIALERGAEVMRFLNGGHPVHVTTRTKLKSIDRLFRVVSMTCVGGGYVG